MSLFVQPKAPLVMLKRSQPAENVVGSDPAYDYFFVEGSIDDVEKYTKFVVQIGGTHERNERLAYEVIQDVLYQRVPKPQPKQPAARAVVVIPSPVEARRPALEDCKISNPNRLWLTYETRFNWPLFTKTNQEVRLNLYAMERDKTFVILADEADLDLDTLKRLRDVFFPLTGTGKLRTIGAPPWSEKYQFAEMKPVAVHDGSRDSHILILPKWAVFPYNIRDNTPGSEAMGTYCSSRFGFGTRLYALDGPTLPMWSTASRSSIADLRVEYRLEQFIKAKLAGDKAGANQLCWPGSTYTDLSPVKFLNPPESGNKAFQINEAGFETDYFSVKSGVDQVGFQHQPGKARLEANSILACMRSAYIRETERIKNFLDPRLVILTEVLTVTERDPRWGPWFAWHKKQLTEPHTVPEPEKPKTGDGFQVRSLKGLKFDSEYFPPTSIPFVRLTGKGEKLRVSEDSAHIVSLNPRSTSTAAVALGQPLCMSMLTELRSLGAEELLAWKNFWKVHYAEALGRAKARLLLRYGLQGFGGNAQNFLLEMKDGIPTGGVVIRDMGDYALHDFVLWALWGDDESAPPDPRIPASLPDDYWSIGLVTLADYLTYVVFGGEPTNPNRPGSEPDRLEAARAFYFQQLRLRQQIFDFIEAKNSGDDFAQYLAGEVRRLFENWSFTEVDQITSRQDLDKQLKAIGRKSGNESVVVDSFTEFLNTLPVEVPLAETPKRFDDKYNKLFRDSTAESQFERKFKLLGDAEAKLREIIAKFSSGVVPPKSREDAERILGDLSKTITHVDKKKSSVGFSFDPQNLYRAMKDRLNTCLKPVKAGLDRKAQKEFNVKWQERFSKNRVLSFECVTMHALDDEEYPTFTGYHRGGDHSTFHTLCPNCEDESASTAAFVGHISPLWAYALPVSPQAIDRLYSVLTCAELTHFFQIEAEWCIAHGRAWAGFIEHALGLAPDSLGIRWDAIDLAAFMPKFDGEMETATVEDVERFTTAKAKWTAGYKAMKECEMAAGWIVENFLATVEGQAALKLYQQNWRDIED
jgi:hypothetical protein